MEPGTSQSDPTYSIGTVQKWLEGESVKMRMFSKGWEKSKPVAPNTHPDVNDDPEGLQKNQRVEITLDS